jgi:hypothetical protein
MNRFLTMATAIALGLSSCGIAKGGGRTELCGYERFEPNRPSNGARDLCHVNYWGWRFDWDELRYVYPWWFDLYGDHYNPWWSDPNDLRYFDYWQVERICLQSPAIAGAASTFSIGRSSQPPVASAMRSPRRSTTASCSRPTMDPLVFFASSTRITNSFERSSQKPRSSFG